MCSPAHLQSVAAERISSISDVSAFSAAQYIWRAIGMHTPHCQSLMQTAVAIIFQHVHVSQGSQAAPQRMPYKQLMFALPVYWCTALIVQLAMNYKQILGAHCGQTAVMMRLSKKLPSVEAT